MSWQINIFWHSIFVMMSDWLYYCNQNLNVYDILFMPVLFLFSMCINRYTHAKQLQFVSQTQMWSSMETFILPKIIFHLSSCTTAFQKTVHHILCSNRLLTSGKTSILQDLIAQQRRWHTYKFYNECKPKHILTKFHPHSKYLNFIRMS